MSMHEDPGSVNPKYELLFLFCHLVIFLIFFKIGSIPNISGMVSPNKNPQGFKGSIWSKMSFMIASSGIERNIPGTPQSAFPAITTITENSAFILTFDATILGTM